MEVSSCCLLWIDEAKGKDKTFIWVSVYWQTTNYEIYAPRTHWVGRGTGTPKDKDEVNKREVCECEGWVWDLDAIGTPSRLRLIRKAPVLVRTRPTFPLNCWAKAARWKWNWPLLNCADWTPESLFLLVFDEVYYESMKRKVKIKPLYECRCNGKLQTKRFTRLSHTGLVVKTRLTNEKFASVKGECEI